MRRAFDAGAVVEFYPSRRSIIRLDVGDTIVHIRRATRKVFADTSQTTGGFTHKLQAGTGFGFGF